MKDVIQAAALISTLALLSNMAMADHHGGNMSGEGHDVEAHEMSGVSGNDGEALVKDGGVQSGYNAQRETTGGILDDEAIVRDGGVQSGYNAQRETTGGILDDAPIVEDGGVQSNYNPVAPM
ncbi:hypothetical protein RSO41_15965 [Halomonas sp. I1]|uniref:hypothetical protein n=1 Tax=Halomonas sp. I1 TaxID=393536 RepID=UPI0028DDF0AB|nr:hypothetical protein [Halomonas sp. I1]MDT8896145.1 hypothetical protein [Halomonas sp. I1]